MLLVVISCTTFTEVVFANVVNACGKSWNCHLKVSLILGDDKSADINCWFNSIGEGECGSVPVAEFQR